LVFHLDQGIKIFVSKGKIGGCKKALRDSSCTSVRQRQTFHQEHSGETGRNPKTEDLKINYHDVVYMHARMFMDRGGFLIFSRRLTQDAYAMHVHCENSERYYVMYTFAQPHISQQVGGNFRAYNVLLSVSLILALACLLVSFLNNILDHFVDIAWNGGRL
jgi:hypothetical protein